MKKELCVFRITGQHRTGNDQEELRRGIIDLLEIAPIEFTLENHLVEGKYKRNFPSQSFTFETQGEARQFALKILRTGLIFFCELNNVEVK